MRSLLEQIDYPRSMSVPRKTKMPRRPKGWSFPAHVCSSAGRAANADLNAQQKEQRLRRSIAAGKEPVDEHGGVVVVQLAAPAGPPSAEPRSRTGAITERSLAHSRLCTSLFVQLEPI